MKSSFIIIVMLTVMTATSCFTIKTPSVKSAKKLFETYYVGTQGTQYYIKPVLFTGESDSNLELDITFRYKDKISDSAIVNFSLNDAEIFKSADSLVIFNGDCKLVLDDPRLIFAERYKSVFKSRFSCRADLAELKRVFEKSNWTILFYSNNSTRIFYALKSSAKNIDKISFGVFDFL
jgi:hypothetical protein